MTTPSVVRYSLTFHFKQAITTTTTSTKVQSVEVCVIPLTTPSNATFVATYVGGLVSQTVVLENPDNPIVFRLVPSYAPGLTEPLNYRVMWREGGVTGRTYTYDFAMPAADVNFEELQDLGNILTGTAYLTWADLGVPGRICQLNDAGVPVDAFGVPVPAQADVVALHNQITAEIVAREAADSRNLVSIEAQLEQQVGSAISTAQGHLDDAVDLLVGADQTEKARAQAAEGVLTDNYVALGSSVTTRVSDINASIDDITTALTHKADLDDDDLIPIAQIPPEAITNWIPLSHANDRLSLHYPGDLQLGDIVLTPSGVYGLIGTNPSDVADWYLLNEVLSVNDQVGNVVLGAADVGAIALGASISEDQVTGLSTALGLKASQLDLTTLSDTVTGILDDTTYVHTVGGVIPHTLNDSNMAYINNLDQVTKKDGTVISTGGGGGSVVSVNGQTGVVSLGSSDVGAIAVGGAIQQSQITGLATTLSHFVLLTDPSVTNARTPTSHAASHGSSGSDPVTLAQSQITGLAALLSGNQLTPSTNAINRIGSLEGQVAALTSGGGGGGGGGAASTTPFWLSSNTTSNVTDLSTVTLNSPFGIDYSGHPYYNYNGALSNEVAYPVITPGGHLKLYRWNENNPPDPVYALGSDLTALSGNVSTLSTTVGTLATQSALAATNANVAALQSGKASLVGGTVPLNQLPAIPISQVTSLQSTLNTFPVLSAGKLDVSVIPTGVPQANIQNLSTTLATLCPLVNGTVPLANVPTNIPASSIAGLSSALPNKADLVGGTVPLNQLPTNIPATSITGLSGSLTTKADLVSGTVPLNQMPTNIPQSSIVGLTTALSNTVSLSGGYLQYSQFPFAAIPHTVVVANQAAMLALTTSQVHVGDTAIIPSGSAQGSYVLMSLPPSTLGNWQLYPAPPSPVTSVNNYTGAITLQASDVGALASNANIPQSQITGLTSLLGTFATTTALNSAIMGVPSTAQVQNMLSTSQGVRGRVSYVATSSVPSTSGQQSIDGVIVALGSVVLLTAQPSSINNGLWTVNYGAWTRPADMATGTYCLQDTVVMVSASSNPGTNNNNTFWQMTASSGVVDTNAQSWVKVMTAGPPNVYTQGNGVSITNNVVAAVPVSPGITVTSAGIGANFAGGAVGSGTHVCGIYSGAVPGGSATPTITHNLNTNYIASVSVIDTGSGNMRLVPWAVLSPNTVQLGFGSVVQPGTYSVVVTG